MSRGRVYDAQDGFGAGLNTIADESRLASNEFRVGENVRLTEQGAASKRFGSRRLHSTALASGLPVQGGFGWQRPGGSLDLVVAGGTLFTGLHALATIFTPQGSGLGTGPLSFAAFLQGNGTESVYIANGGPLRRYDPVGGLVTLNTPNVSRLAVYNRRLFGVRGDDEKLLFSSLDNGDTLGVVPSGGGEVIVRTFSDQRLTTVAAFRSSLYLFHVSGISRFTGVGLDDIQVAAGSQGLTSDVGTQSPRSVVPVENGVFFLSDRGAYIAGDGGVTPVSPRIDNRLSTLTKAQVERAVSVHNRRRREVLLYIPDIGCYVYQYRTGAWTGPWTGGYLSPHPVTDIWETTDSDGVPVVSAGNSGGWVLRVDMDDLARDDVLFDGTAGQPYTMRLGLRRQFSGGIAEEKSYRWAYVLSELGGSTATSLAWTTTTDSDSFTLTPQGSAWGSGAWGTGVWGGGGVLPFRVPIYGRGGFIDLLLESKDDKLPLFSRVETEAFNMGRRGN